MNIKQKLFIGYILLLSFSLQAQEISLGAVHITADPEEVILSDVASKSVEKAAKTSKGETLGDFLEDEQFVDSASYGPAVGRPVIKGMDGYRVGVTNGNIILNDLSAMSQDHAVGIMPRASEKIEIIKGPSSLLYGSYSGGVVHVVGEENEPELLKAGYHLDGTSQYGTNGAGYSGGATIKVSEHNISAYLNTFYNKANNYYDGDGKEIQDSDTRSLQSHVVLGYRADENNVIKLYADKLGKEYGIPNATIKRTSIEMEQETYGLVWHNKELFDGVEKFQTELRYSDYLHSEYEGGRADGLFGQKQLSFSSFLDYYSDDWYLKGHVQYLKSELKVCHEHGKCTHFYDAQRTSIQDGIEIEKTMALYGIPFSHGHPMPNTTDSTANIGMNVGTFLDDDTELSATLRVEHRILEADSSNIQEVWLVTPEVYPGYYDTQTTFAKSFSVGLSGAFSESLTYQTSLGYIERLPSVPELYWNGFHHATDSYIFGNRDLENEQSINLDVDLMYQNGGFQTLVGGFYYDFNNYIYQAPLADANGTVMHDPYHNSDVWKVEGVGAKVYGIALQQKYTTQYKTHKLTPAISFEAIRGILKDGGNIPRMSPYNATVALEHVYKQLTTTLKYKYVDKSRFVAKNETETPGYSWVSLYMEYADRFKYGEYALYFKGENLTDALAYNHLSFLKETAPLPGRQLTLGFDLKF